MMVQNLHTHTVFGDGSNTPEEMVRGALLAGCASLGFSEHSPLAPFYDPDGYAMDQADLPAYREEVLRLGREYAGRLEIFLGLEQDYDSPAPAGSFDYLIGSVHAVVADGACLSVDNTREILMRAVQEHFGGDYLSLAEAYFQRAGDIAAKTGCQIIGHFDLLTKFNEGDCLFDTAAPRYVDAAMGALERLLAEDVLFEINTGAMSRGYRSAPYPAPFLLRSIRERGGRVCITSDCHRAGAVTYAFSQAAEAARAAGFRETWVLTGSGFHPVGLEQLRSSLQQLS